MSCPEGCTQPLPADTTTKRCAGCKKAVSLERFAVGASRCKVCVDRRTNQRSIKRKATRPGQRWCSMCAKSQPIEAFTSDQAVTCQGCRDRAQGLYKKTNCTTTIEGTVARSDLSPPAMAPPESVFFFATDCKPIAPCENTALPHGQSNNSGAESWIDNIFVATDSPCGHGEELQDTDVEALAGRVAGLLIAHDDSDLYDDAAGASMADTAATLVAMSPQNRSTALSEMPHEDREAVLAIMVQAHMKKSTMVPTVSSPAAGFTILSNALADAAQRCTIQLGRVDTSSDVKVDQVRIEVLSGDLQMAVFRHLDLPEVICAYCDCRIPAGIYRKSAYHMEEDFKIATDLCKPCFKEFSTAAFSGAAKYSEVFQHESFLRLAAGCCKQWATTALFCLSISSQPERVWQEIVPLGKSVILGVLGEALDLASYCAVASGVSGFMAMPDLMMIVFAHLPSVLLPVAAGSCKQFSLASLVIAMASVRYSTQTPEESARGIWPGHCKQYRGGNHRWEIPFDAGPSAIRVVEPQPQPQRLPPFMLFNLTVLEVFGIMDNSPTYTSSVFYKLFCLLPTLRNLETVAIDGAFARDQCEIDLDHMRACFSQLPRVHTVLGKCGLTEDNESLLAWVVQDMPSVRHLGLEWFDFTESQGEDPGTSPIRLLCVQALAKLQLQSVASLRVDAGFWVTFTGASHQRLQHLQMEWWPEPGVLESLTDLMNNVSQMASLRSLTLMVNYDVFAQYNTDGNCTILHTQLANDVVKQFTRLRDTQVTIVRLCDFCNHSEFATHMVPLRSRIKESLPAIQIVPHT